MRLIYLVSVVSDIIHRKILFLDSLFFSHPFIFQISSGFEFQTHQKKITSFFIQGQLKEGQRLQHSGRVHACGAKLLRSWVRGLGLSLLFPSLTSASLILSSRRCNTTDFPSQKQMQSCAAFDKTSIICKDFAKKNGNNFFSMFGLVQGSGCSKGQPVKELKGQGLESNLMYKVGISRKKKTNAGCFEGVLITS